MNTKVHTIISLSFFILFGASFVYAQIAPQTPSTSLIENKLVPAFAIIVDPPSPSPDELVTVSTQTGALDPNRTHFFWTIDGISRSDISGLGKRTFTFTAGTVGSKNQIAVQAQSMEGSSTSASKTVYVSDLVLPWTTNTYIPRWYKGKALPIPKSTVRVTAIPTFIPDGIIIPANKLIYSWNINGKRVLRGVGEQTLEFKEPEQSWDVPNIVLTVEDLSQRIKKQVRAQIATKNPRAVIYQSLPLGGIEFRSGTSAFAPIAPGVIDLQVEPFFFNQISKYDLKYQWSVQNKVASSTPQNPFILTLDTQTLQESTNIPIAITIEDTHILATDLYSPTATNVLSIPIRR